MLDVEYDVKQIQKKKKKKKSKDLQLADVENLKDRLGRHAAELESLFGKKRGAKLEEEYEESDEEDDSDLEFEIQELYNKVKRNLALMKGEDVVVPEKT